MLRIHFSSADLAAVRFAISPLIETIRSVRALEAPDSRALHLPWIAETLRATADLDLGPLFALLPTGAYTPDFVHPPPSGPFADFDDEVARMLETPGAQVRAEIRRAYRSRPVPAALGPLMDDPDRELPQLAELIREYWRRAVAPHWPRLRALMEGDILYRARQLTDGGAARLFADVDPTVSWRDGALWIDKPWDEALDLAGRGLLFVPSAFVWPFVSCLTEPPWQPTLVYPVRGVATLWEQRPAAPGALAALLGRSRADIICDLEAPRSTTELSRRIGLTPGGVSQHLSVLSAAGLVNRHPVGRSVLYVRSPTGDALVSERSFSTD